MTCSCNKEQCAWFFLRLSLGLLMLWSFFDKLWGLGFNTCLDAKTGVVQRFCGQAWIYGGSPTTGFLKFGVHGPFAEIFHKMAGSGLVDWLFMLGLLFVGLSFILGIMTRLAGYAGALMMLLMYLALLPPEHHPFLDEHIIYLIIFLGLASKPLDPCCGLSKWWMKTKLVEKNKIFQ